MYGTGSVQDPMQIVSVIFCDWDTETPLFKPKNFKNIYHVKMSNLLASKLNKYWRIFYTIFSSRVVTENIWNDKCIEKANNRIH